MSTFKTTGYTEALNKSYTCTHGSLECWDRLRKIHVETICRLILLPFHSSDSLLCKLLNTRSGSCIRI
jgi:hypothetical protein